MPQGPTDLHGELVVKSIDEVTDVVRDVAEMQVLTPPIAGIENFLEVFAGGHDRLVVWQRAVTEIVDRRYIPVGLDDPAGKVGKLLLEANVSGHGKGL